MPNHKEHKSTLTEKPGIIESKQVNPRLNTPRSKRRSQYQDTSGLVSGLLQGHITELSRAITLIESRHPKHSEQAKDIVNACLPHARNSIRIGITGVPGVGKSTFIEALGMYLTGLGKKVAVLAVDPSSSITKGSILGDKTRMEQLSINPQAFIRPSASGASLGGVARKTRETMTLCEAAGFDVILIETVGVGQSETAVHSMVDFFLLLKLAGAGDELQGIKRGIMEMADAIAINKADGDNLKPAKLARVEFERALHYYPAKPSGWQPKSLLCSALKNEGIEDIWTLVETFETQTKTTGYFQKNRQDQNKYWLLQTIENQLKSAFFNRPNIQKELQNQLLLIEENKTTPFAAADVLLGMKN